MYDVIIIGGGATGLMAAKILSANHKVLVLEAKDRLGGRIYPVNSFSFPAEGGAEFIHGNLKTTFGLLKEAHLNKEKIKGTFCKVEKGKWYADNHLVPGWELLIQRMKDCKKDVSIHDFLDISFKEKKFDALKKYFTKYIEGYDAANPVNTSVFAIRKEMEAGDAPQYRPEPGYYSLADYLKEACVKNGASIRINEPVIKLSRNKNIEIFTSQKKYFCKKVICAVPLGVLQSTQKQKSFIDFPDFLKGHLNAAKKIGNGPVIKFLLEFDKAFWFDKNFLKDKNIQAPSYLFTDTAIPTWWTQYPSQEPLLTGWIAGPSSYKMRNYSTKKFKQIVLESLSLVFTLPVDDLQKRLKNFRVVNWINQAYILGGYSYPTLQTTKARKILQKPFDNAFYFAGEYVPKNSSSTVDAALLSGKLVAEQIVKGN
ncbi:MAG TPA: NAD(P)/FAD-dependent oxidoreductase [Hanamia sp.]